MYKDVILNLYLRDVKLSSQGEYKKSLPEPSVLIKDWPVRSGSLRYYVSSGNLYKVSSDELITIILITNVNIIS